MAEQPERIRAGQIWRRKKDGVIIRISRDYGFDDHSWSAIEGNRKGRSYGTFIRRGYDFVAESGDTNGR